MKKKLVLILCAALVFTAPFNALTVQATEPETQTEQSSEIETPRELSTVTISAYNTSTRRYISNVSFRISDRDSGNTVSFTKVNPGVYEVDNQGGHRYIEPSDGEIKIRGLNGSYTIEDVSESEDITCISRSANLSIVDGESKNVEFEYSDTMGTLRVTLISEDDSAISDASFTIKNQNGGYVYFDNDNGVYKYSESSSSYEIRTNSSGMITLELPPGTYTIDQESAPIEYNGELPSKTVTVDSKRDMTVSLVNTKHYGTLSMVVLGEDGTNLTGAGFTLSMSNGDNVYVTKTGDGYYQYSRTSGETEILSYDGSVTVTGLPKGTYMAEQRTGAPGYEVSEKKEFDVKDDSTSTISFKNERSVGSIIIEITDEETQEPVAGFTYRILTKENEEPILVKKGDNGYVYAPDGKEDLKTDENGRIRLEGVPTGSYYISQYAAASGYLLDVDDVECQVVVREETSHTTTASKSNSAVVVVDKDGEPVVGVSFIIVDADGNKVFEDVTNENGKYLISGAAAGEYTLTIEKVPETFAPYKKKMPFSLDNTGLSDGLGRITLEYNKVVLETDKDGVEMVITNKESGEAVTEVTNEDGVATFYGLPYGEYGITLADTSTLFKEIEFTVDENFSSVSYNIELAAGSDADSSSEEEELSEIGEVTQTKKTNNNAIMIMIAVLVALGAGIYGWFVYKKKKDQNKNSYEGLDSNIKVGYDESGNAVIFEEVEVESEDEESEDSNEDECLEKDEDAETDTHI